MKKEDLDRLMNDLAKAAKVVLERQTEAFKQAVKGIEAAARERDCSGNPRRD